MKTIRQRILAGFCLAVVLVILAIGLAVTWKIRQGIDWQSKLIHEDIIAQAHKRLEGHNRIVRASLENERENIRRHTAGICENLLVAHNIESRLAKSLRQMIAASCQSAEIDYAAVYSVSGELLAAFPVASLAGTVENMWNSWDLLRKIRGHLDSADGSPVILDTVEKHESEFFQAFGLEDRDAGGAGGIGFVSAGIVLDDFGDPMGVFVNGKLLNGFDKPLAQMHAATNSAAVVYLGNTPLAYAGIRRGGKKTIKAADLKLDSALASKILEQEAPVCGFSDLAGQTYITTSTRINTSEGEAIGILSVGLPQNEIHALGELVSGNKKLLADIQLWIVAIGGLALAVFIFIAFWIAYRINRSLHVVVDGLVETSQNLDSASDELDSVARLAADSASEQVASLEETAELSKEMTGRARENADSADLAGQAEAKARQMLDNAKKALEQTLTAMVEIRAGGEETSEIVKTIDQIAFQTNLLALNAAVEAAHAGDIGAGFAVVAEEVRSLAMRAAESARSTSELIEKSLAMINTGSEHADKMRDVFGDSVERHQEMKTHIEMIMKNAREQALGFKQIDGTLATVEQETRRTAANAEETAATSEQIVERSEQLKEFIAELTALAGGGKQGDAPVSGWRFGALFRRKSGGNSPN